MKKQEQEQTGRVNYIWVLAGGYLIYLGGKLLLALWQDHAEPAALFLAAALVFFAVGGWLIRREWKAYKYAAAHKDDPSTWNDELAEAARQEAELAESDSEQSAEEEDAT